MLLLRVDPVGIYFKDFGPLLKSKVLIYFSTNKCWREICVFLFLPSLYIYKLIKKKS